jgi:hypothetical protein
MARENLRHPFDKRGFTLRLGGEEVDEAGGEESRVGRIFGHREAKPCQGRRGSATRPGRAAALRRARTAMDATDLG